MSLSGSLSALLQGGRNLVKYYCREKPLCTRLLRQYPLRVMSSLDTLRHIAASRCSVARFGDGEFELAFGSAGIGFQEGTAPLREALLDTLTRPRDNLLVCLPSLLTPEGLSMARGSSERYWRRFAIQWQKRIHDTLHPPDSPPRVFGDAFLTRPYIVWKHPAQHAKPIFEHLKRLWHDRDLLILEGTMTRLGVGNDLFRNARSLRRILAPPTNAFAKRHQLAELALQFASPDTLVLLALGPTATILATMLSEHGIQALDVGHVDIEYSWFLAGATEKSAVPGKFTNEAPDGRIPFQPAQDHQYLREIIAAVPAQKKEKLINAG